MKVLAINGVVWPTYLPIVTTDLLQPELVDWPPAKKGAAMVKTTRAQREALFRLFQRDFPNWVSPGKRRQIMTGEIVPVPTIQWRKFRAKVQPYFDGSGCIMVPWANMWIGIEKGGYTHS